MVRTLTIKSAGLKKSHQLKESSKSNQSTHITHLEPTETSSLEGELQTWLLAPMDGVELTGVILGRFGRLSLALPLFHFSTMK